MRTDFDYGTNGQSQRLADLKHRAEELERQLSDARTSLQRELGQFSHEEPPHAGTDHDFYGYPPAAGFNTGGCDTGDLSTGDLSADDLSAGDLSADGFNADGFNAKGFSADRLSTDGLSTDSLSASGYEEAASPDEERTEALVSNGRSSAHRSGWAGRRVKWIAVGVAALALLVAMLLLTLTGGSASWPASVATVQRESAKACQNPDVKSEPGQVNFACGKDTRQILWVFALMTSANNPNFADTQTGRVGLEPITASQGGELAWSLNLHHPYNPFNPIDSLAVAARAINNIIGGATVTGTNGNPVVQPGLENDPTNCLRYTGSAEVTSRKGFPGLCAKPITSQAGQAALVADVFQKWIVGAAPQSAQDAAVLFANAKNPGDARVQAILKHLPTSKPLA